jgi:hypothetical protein
MGMTVSRGPVTDGDTVQNVPMWCCCLKQDKGTEYSGPRI